jgi:hypothetical protein
VARAFSALKQSARRLKPAMDCWLAFIKLSSADPTQFQKFKQASARK